MTTDPKSGSAASLARAGLLDPSPFAGKKVPTTPPSFIQLCHLSEWTGWNAGIDLKARANRIIATDAASRYRLTDRELSLLKTVVAKPDAKSLLRLEQRFASRAVRDNVCGDLDYELAKFCEVLPFHRAAYGEQAASAWCSALCLRIAQDDFDAGQPAVGLRALKAALLYAQDTNVDGTRVPYQPAPRYPELVAYETLATDWLPSFVALAAAEKMIADEDDVLRGGAGIVASPHQRLDDVLELAHLQPRAEAGPTLVVLAKGAVDHLPGSLESGSTSKPGTTSSSPRVEWQPWAGKAVELVHGIDAHAAAKILEGEFPYAAAELRQVLGDTVGARFTRPKPTLFLGTPGCGKTRAARRLAEVLRLPLTVYSCAGVADGAFGGTSRQWSTGRACVPLQAIRRAGVANPLILLDEINRAGTRAENGRITDTLISLLEVEGARLFHDPFLETAVDLSAVAYLATANSLTNIPEALLDRFRVIRFPEPRAQDLPVLAAALTASFREERGLDETWCPNLAADEIELLSRHWTGGSLRVLARLTEALLNGRDSLSPRH